MKMAIFDNLFKPNIERLKKKGDINGLIKALSHKEWMIRYDAAYNLGELANIRARESLIPVLEDENQEVARKAEEALIKLIPPEEARELARKARAKRLAAETTRLIIAIKDKDESVSQQAAQAFGKLGEVAVDPLIAVYKETLDHKIERKVEWVFGELKNVRAVKPLMEKLTKYNLFGRGYETRCDGIMEIFTKFGKVATDPLITILLTKTTTSGYYDSHSAVATVLGRIGDLQAVEPLMEVLKHSGYHYHLAASAAEALGRIGDPRAVESLVEAVVQYGNSRDGTTVSQAAKEALLRFGPAAIVPLTNMLVHPYGYVGSAAAEVLQKSNWQPTDANQRGLYLFHAGRWDDAASVGGKAIELLVETLDFEYNYYSAEQHKKCQHAAEVLGKIGDVRGVQWLISDIKKDQWAESSVRVLTRVLQAKPQGVKSEDLQIIAQLKEVKEKYQVESRNPITDEYESETRWKEVDCSQLRQIAQQELSTRE